MHSAPLVTEISGDDFAKLDDLEGRAADARCEFCNARANGEVAQFQFYADGSFGSGLPNSGASGCSLTTLPRGFSRISMATRQAYGAPPGSGTIEYAYAPPDFIVDIDLSRYISTKLSR